MHLAAFLRTWLTAVVVASYAVTTLAVAWYGWRIRTLAIATTHDGARAASLSLPA